MQAITISPVSIGIDAFQKDFLNYKSGIYNGQCKHGIEDVRPTTIHDICTHMHSENLAPTYPVTCLGRYVWI